MHVGQVRSRIAVAASGPNGGRNTEQFQNIISFNPLHGCLRRALFLYLSHGKTSRMVVEEARDIAQ